MALLNPLGGKSSTFKANTVGRIAIIERSKVSFTGTVQSNRSVTDITAITVAGTEKFQEIFYVDDSAILNQTSVKDANNNRVDQTLEFKVDEISIEMLNELQNDNYILLVQYPDENWYLVGSHGKGLSTKGENTFNASGDDNTAKIVLKGICLGFAPNITMTDSAVEALINTVVTP